MNKIFKRILTLMLVAVMLLSSCAAEDPSDVTDIGNSSENSSETEKPTEKPTEDVEEGGLTEALPKPKYFTVKYTNTENGHIDGVEKVEQAGFPVYMVEYAGLYKIQVGAYRERANAVAQCEALESAGFDAYITTRSGNAVSTKKTIDEVAREVLQGKWGNGSERKRRLTQAGYDYNAVQERVNELL